MASIQLTRYEAEEGDLPAVCMRCGAPATVRKRRLFVSHPLWVYVLLPFGYLPYVIVAAVLTQRVRCYTLFCPRHKNHWLVRALLVWGAFVVILGLIIGSFLLLFLLEKQLGVAAAPRLGGLLCLASFVLMFCWVISIPVMQLTAIHPADVTERRFTLKRVSPFFVEAVRDYREISPGDEEQGDRRREFPLRGSEPGIFDPEHRRQGRPRRDSRDEDD